MPVRGYALVTQMSSTVPVSEPVFNEEEVRCYALVTATLERWRIIREPATLPVRLTVPER